MYDMTEKEWMYENQMILVIIFSITGFTYKKAE